MVAERPAPEISVVMNVRDGAAYVHEALDSILGQTFGDFEAVIVDDGSNDGTWDILRAYAARDPRIVLLRNDRNEGIYVSANKGLRAARGRYVARMDADDIMDPSRLALQKACLDRRPAVVLACSNWTWDSPGSRAPSGLPGSDILTAWFLLFYNHLACQSAVMFRRAEVLDTGGYNEKLPVAADYELWVRLSRRFRVSVMQENLVRFRRNMPGSVTLSRLEQQQHVSALVSGKAIALLTGEAEPFPARDFWAFWPIFWKQPYPPADRAEEFHRRLMPVYRAFVEHWRQRFPDEHAEADLLVRTAVAKAFRLWADSRKTDAPDEATLLRGYADRWAPERAKSGLERP